jgi:hypothetical protein
MRNLNIGGDLYSTGADLLDEGLIMAYVDGELDEEGRLHVEDLLAKSAEAREIAELMRSSSALLKSAFLDDTDWDDPDCDIASAVSPTVEVPENPDALPTPSTIEQTRLCHPMAEAVAIHNPVQGNA